MSGAKGQFLKLTIMGYHLEKYSFGAGDRFGKEAGSQLEAIMEIRRLGIPVVPVWNKSNREHVIIGSSPENVKAAVAAAVAVTGYSGSYYTDADHIGLETVDRFTVSCNFFTLDVAHFIGKKPLPEMAKDFAAKYSKYLGTMKIPGIKQPLNVSLDFLHNLAGNYLVAVDEVARIYEHLCDVKGKGNFITEVSVDEAKLVQGPLELFFILALLKEKGVEVQNIAPKFSGLFAKGVDYIGDVKGFTAEFEQHVAVIRYAVKELGLPQNLKLSVHSGSDKFSIYPAIKAALRKFDAGIHVKTAGTTWLEEVIGLAKGGPDGLAIAREIYTRSLERYEELTAPYATVLHIDRQLLPAIGEVNSWNSKQFTEALIHDKLCRGFHPHFRQLIHVGYKIAAEMGKDFLDALDRHHEIIAAGVKHNLLERHLKPLFL